MAPRKDMMRIIRRDAGFSAKLGFGETTGAQRAIPETAKEETAAAREADFVPSGVQADGLGHPRKEEEGWGEPSPVPRQPQGMAGAGTGSVVQVQAPPAAVRGTVVYVAVSLTAGQAVLAEAWARAARCNVPFLIRRVAQGLRGRIVEDWERSGMPDVTEARGARGKYPTSVTLTLPPRFAADLAARHDPLGLLGLGRAMGPAFRAAFQVAFDDALEQAKASVLTMGDTK